MPVLSQMLCKCEQSTVKVCIVFPVWIMQAGVVGISNPLHEVATSNDRILVGNTFKG